MVFIGLISGNFIYAYFSSQEYNVAIRSTFDQFFAIMIIAILIRSYGKSLFSNIRKRKMDSGEVLNEYDKEGNLKCIIVFNKEGNLIQKTTLENQFVVSVDIHSGKKSLTTEESSVSFYQDSALKKLETYNHTRPNSRSITTNFSSQIFWEKNGKISHLLADGFKTEAK